MSIKTDEEIAREAIQKIRANLEENQRMAGVRDAAMARMYLSDGLSQAEVARRVGMSESAVRLAVTIYRATTGADTALAG